MNYETVEAFARSLHPDVLRELLREHTAQAEDGPALLRDQFAAAITQRVELC